MERTDSETCGIRNGQDIDHNGDACTCCKRQGTQ
ncbi:hypothetical protein SAMN02745673_03310 [Marinactinospora thermotolerans DSM 45154]|uniref:Uncharacterized protein n=1 Tax=Marinactinospora thermotolerans DSM 45154 TaxID=1122192 RepID=A0A1T4SAY8_9ACTN|nr:hypothetical protein SAMN02745673_03310 [Marinactinospora thermotolerans DSM 45154]